MTHHVDVTSLVAWHASGCPGEQPVAMSLDAIAPPRQPYVALRLAVLPDEPVDDYRGRLTSLVRAGKLAPGAVGIAVEGEGMAYAGRRWVRAGTLAGEIVVVCSEGGERGAALRREAAEALARAGWAVTLDDRRLPAVGDQLYVTQGPLQGHRVEVTSPPMAGRVGINGPGAGSALVLVDHLAAEVVKRRRRHHRPDRSVPLNAAVGQLLTRQLGRGWATERRGDRVVAVKRGPNGPEQSIEAWNPDEGTERLVKQVRGW